jgi:hypothetical protein
MKYIVMVALIFVSGDLLAGSRRSIGRRSNRARRSQWVVPAINKLTPKNVDAVFSESRKCITCGHVPVKKEADKCIICTQMQGSMPHRMFLLKLYEIAKNRPWDKAHKPPTDL